MTEQEIRKIVLASVKKIKADLEEDKVSDETSFSEDIGLDSMALMNLASVLEQSFDRALALTNWVNENRDTTLTVGSLIKYLEKVIK